MGKSSLHGQILSTWCSLLGIWFGRLREYVKSWLPVKISTSSCTTLSEPVIFTFKIRVSFVSPWNLCSLQVHSVVSSPCKFHQIDQYVHHQKNWCPPLYKSTIRLGNHFPNIFPLGFVAIYYHRLAADWILWVRCLKEIEIEVGPGFEAAFVFFSELYVAPAAVFEIGGKSKGCRRLQSKKDDGDVTTTPSTKL